MHNKSRKINLILQQIFEFDLYSDCQDNSDKKTKN